MPYSPTDPGAGDTRGGEPCSASIKIRVQLKASSNELLGLRGKVVRLRVTAAPEGGKANEAVVALLAEKLGIAKSGVTIVRGHTSREKVVMVASLSLEEVWRRLGMGKE